MKNDKNKCNCEISCHCEECVSTTRQSTAKMPQWIATLPLVARNDGKKAAFTLAEVLITLTIIGVIAAITIPNLMQTYKKHQVEVAIKDAYSILSNALTMAKTEHGDIDDMLNNTYSGGRNINVTLNPYFSENYVEPYIKFNKKCRPEQSNCRVFTDENLKALNDNWPGGNGYLYVISWFQQLALANGMYLGISNYSVGKTFVFIVDINGGKGPNKYGHDIFTFTIDSDRRLIGGASYPPSKANWLKYSCNDGGGAGYNCAAAIHRNGWRIPDDYPVKKW